MSRTERAEVVIVGGGIAGLMCAFFLTRHGMRDIVVVDANYPQGGASGRNGTLVRGGFSSPEWCRFYGHSLELWQGLSAMLGENVMYTRRGYAIIAESERTADICAEALAAHRETGVQSRALNAAALKRVLPNIDHARVRANVYFDNGGVAPHHAVMKGLMAACRRAGVDLRYHTRVTGIETAAGRATGVAIGDDRIEADTVVLAGGGHNLELATLAGVELDGVAMRIQAIATEPLRPLIGPGLALIDRAAYLHQTARGEVMGGCEVVEPHRADITSDLPIMAATAHHFVTMFPALASVRVLRQWSGILHVSSDYGQLLGPHPDLDGLWLSAGWLYGIAGAPAGGALLAKAIATGEIDDRMRPFAVDRSRRGAAITERSLVMLE